jgi:hypothetical protein
MKFSIAKAGLLSAGNVIAVALTGQPDMIDTDLLRRGDRTMTGSLRRHSRADYWRQRSKSSMSSRSNPVQTSSNWGGGLSTLSAGTINSASAFFIIPNPVMPSGGSTKAIDYLLLLGSASMATTITAKISSRQGSTSTPRTASRDSTPGTSVEWYPQPPVYFNSTQYPVEAGDTVLMHFKANAKNTREYE